MLFNLLYYVGILACALQGTEKAIEKTKYFTVAIAYIASMGGGMLRDILVLRTSPVAFTSECIPEAFICILAVCYINGIKQYSLYGIILDCFDAIGVGCFIVIGVDRAISFGAKESAVLISGALTALGGGITSSLICGTKLKKLFTQNNQYRFVVATGDVAYVMGCSREVIIIGVFIATVLTNERIKAVLVKKVGNAGMTITCEAPSYKTLMIHISIFAFRCVSIGTYKSANNQQNLLNGLLRYRCNIYIVFRHIQQFAT